MESDGRLLFRSIYDPPNGPFVFIEALHANVDTRPEDGGFVWYRDSTSPDLLQRTLSDIQHAYPSVSHINHMFITTWDHVGYFDSNTDKVSYPFIHSWESSCSVRTSMLDGSPHNICILILSSILFIIYL